MASYTMPLSNLIEIPSQYETTLSFDERIEKGRQWLFDFDYPYFKEELRKDFETHFIFHFYNREIGFETEQLFKFKLRTWLLLNMPYWNKMLETDDLISEPLVNVNYTRKVDSGKDVNQNNKQTTNQQANATAKSTDKATGVSDTTNTSTGESDTFSRNLQSDTPDSRLQITTGDKGTGVIEYASQIDENKNTQNATNKDTGKATFNQDNVNDTTNNSTVNGVTDLTANTVEKENEIEHVKGNMGMKTESEMIELYRDILMKWEPMIFKEMEQLFMLVY